MSIKSNTEKESSDVTDDISSLSENDSISDALDLPLAGEDVSDTTEPENADTAITGKDTKAGTLTKIRAPLIIAGVLLIATIMFFAAWACFFNKSIKGSWNCNITLNSVNYNTTFTFDDNNVCKYHAGGLTYNGIYKVSRTDDGKDKLNITLTYLGQPILEKEFYYTLSGNEFSGKKLDLTDVSGLIFTPDNISSENKSEVEMKKKAADYVEENDIRYYIINFNAVSEPKPEIKKYDDTLKDKKLIGIWYDKNEASGYGCTFTFNDDGTYELIYKDVEYAGAYKADNGKLTYNIVTVGGKETEQSLNYTVDGDKLTFNSDAYSSTLTKTDNKYAFESEIK